MENITDEEVRRNKNLNKNKQLGEGETQVSIFTRDNSKMSSISLK